MKREVALKKLKEPHYDINEMERDKITVLNKLDLVYQSLTKFLI